MDLTWDNKNKVLYYSLSEKSISINPIWINEKDFHLMNSFPLELLRTIGDDKSENRLIYGDNLLSLKTLLEEYEGKINCIYIDPPYNTGYAFSTYNDNFEHSEWIGMMYHRILLLHQLLYEEGIIFVQLDDLEHAYLEVLMNMVFKEKNKVGTIIWRRRQSQANLSGTLSSIHDYILIYAKNKEKLHNDRLKSMLWTDTSKYGYNQRSSEEIETYFGSKTAFDTPKPELLIYNLLKISTKENDIVLDSFLGSGTTAAVAHKMKRRYIGIEMSSTAFSLSEGRINQIITEKPQKDVGITKLVHWRGGGGCKIYHLNTNLNNCN
ncbi:MAG: site-specific DNA-methyltransferase [Promethearchaeota archaeon]